MKDTFTPHQDRALLALREKRMSWPDISKQIGRSAEACRARFYKIVPNQEARRKTSRLDMWTEEEMATLDRLCVEGRSSKEIAVILNRTFYAVRAKISYCNSARARANSSMAGNVRVPPELIAERNVRSAARRDLTAVFFGDPPQGYSALDRKRQEVRA